MKNAGVRIISLITGLILLMAISSELNAAAELSVTINRSATQKTLTLPPVHVTDTVLYGVTAINNGTTGVNVATDVIFPSSFVVSSGSGTGISCSQSSRTVLPACGDMSVWCVSQEAAAAQ